MINLKLFFAFVNFNIKSNFSYYASYIVYLSLAQPKSDNSHIIKEKII